MKKLLCFAGVTASLFACSPSYALDLIVNGDFSTPDYSGGWSATTASGWTNVVDSGYVEIGASPIYGLSCISDGCQNMEVNYTTFGTVFQTVSGLTVGKTYDLSWDYGGRTGGGPQQLDVSFGGTPVKTDTGSLGSWTYNEVTVTATNSSEVLQFASVNVGGLPSFGNEVTNVALGVPEPATWALMALGFAGLGFAGYRKGRNGRPAFTAA